MAALQNLIVDLTVTALAPGASVTVAHGLYDPNGPLIPQEVRPDRATPIVVSAINANTVTFTNPAGSTTAQTAIFRTWGYWSGMGNTNGQVPLAPMPWQGQSTGGPLAVALPFGMFFGLTAGTGMGGTDYAATVAVKTAGGTGRVPFPQDGPQTGGIVRVDASSFTLPAAGTYEIEFGCHTTEPGQLQLELNGVDQPQTCAANMNPTAGGHPIQGRALITTVGAAVIAVINPSGNAAALTITPANGSQTHANAQYLIARRIG